MKTIGINDKVTCPHCGEVQFDEGSGAADFVILGRGFGDPSSAQDECDDCYEGFIVTQISETEATIEEA